LFSDNLHKGLGNISTIYLYIPPKKITIQGSKMNIYVGNLSSDIKENDLRKAFEDFGQVTTAKVITDRYTGDSRGFGFVEMPANQEARAAISGLNGKSLNGNALKVNEARPRNDNRGGGFGGGRRY